MSSHVIKHTLWFKTPGGTSRGILKSKDSFFVFRKDEGRLLGLGECSLIRDLSPDNPKLVESELEKIDSTISADSLVKKSIRSHFPAVKMAREMMFCGIERDNPFLLFKSEFTSGKRGIPINGLIWMGTRTSMLEQIKRKINQGFGCLKLKIGAIGFQDEISLLKYIRREFGKNDIEIRVDANGAFSPESALEKLKILSDFELHSIEQPIKAGQWEEMAKLCHLSPLDIALDEELIDVTNSMEKRKVLKVINPQYIILKPSFLGGFQASKEWIELADELRIKWWVTSSLESNVGLSAIAQWVATLSTNMTQGLGTGMLFTNNVPSPLIIKNAKLYYDPSRSWDIAILEEEMK